MADTVWYDFIKQEDEDLTSRQKVDEIKVSNFSKDINSKYISTVSDTDLVLEENSRFKYLASYIFQKNQILGIKLQRYHKSSSGLTQDESFNLPIKQTASLSNFLKFLLDANLATLSSGKFILADNLELEPDLYSKLVSLSKDVNGRKMLQKLFETGYLTPDFDIQDLIKKGLSQNKINEKIKMIDDFEDLIDKPNVKEVAEIQLALSQIPWIFGPEYVSLDIRDAGESGIPDRRLKRIDGLSDILEIKLPSAELIRKDNHNRHFIAPNLAEALGQLTGYLEYYYSVYSTERNDQTKEEILDDTYGKYYKPKGILVIGRRRTQTGTGTKQTDDVHPKYLRRLISYFHWIDVLTYDDLIERAKNGLNNLINN